MASRAVYIVAAKRTPFGTFGGKLKGITATDLGKAAASAALEAGKVPAEAVDSVIVGNVAQSSTDACYLARHVALKAGVPIAVPALTINRLCGSGFQSIINGAHEILLGQSEVVLTGGTESMSQAPYAVRNTRWGSPLGMDLKMEDTLWASLTDSYVKLPMALTAEKLAEQYGITREQCDQFALSSQQKWANADKNGHFVAELAPLEVKGKKGKEVFDRDEHPRETTFEKLGKLPSVFKENGTVSAGNASGICDGAGVVIIASEEACSKHNLTPLARLVAYDVIGVDPTIMGIGPAYAIQNVLKKTKMTLDKIDLVEVNEAFAAQFLSVEKEAGLDREKTNTNGGAIALGHPLAASGSRITAHLVHELQRKSLKYAIGSACIGGGQGIALLLERV
ncbi:3-ketoacyl-CoA thiolase, mitochondrial-like [Halichondria panicea]|uniref:3-ketoacyl-CoA thiolase, mitochondrial-like n=1 Tax=Halichondria panicea TaxID=6063 RepID=UPI00312B58AA